MDYKLCDGEYRLMEIVWELEPVTSTQLYKECLPRLGWKKSTTYTMLRKLCERGLLQNTDSIVTSRVKKEEILSYDSRELVGKRFSRSIRAGRNRRGFPTDPKERRAAEWRAG